MSFINPGKCLPNVSVEKSTKIYEEQSKENFSGFLINELKHNFFRLQIVNKRVSIG